MFHYHPVDVHVGKRLRQRRMLMGLSQTEVGRAIKVSFQQIQKFEKGANRLSSSQLFEFARVLDVPVDFFFEHLPGAAARATTRDRQRRTITYAAPPSQRSDLLNKRETLQLVRAYLKIRLPTLRERIASVVTALAAATPQNSDKGRRTSRRNRRPTRP